MRVEQPGGTDAVHGPEAHPPSLPMLLDALTWGAFCLAATPANHKSVF